MSKKKSGRRVWRGVTTATASLLALSVCASTVVDGFRTDIDKFLGTKSTKLVTENSDGTDLYTFKSDYTSTTELLHGIQDVGERMSEEGSVLLKNNGALPLTKDETQKITLLGFSSYYPVQGGDMGSSLVENTGTDADTVDMVGAFKAKGFGLNQTVADMYEALKPTYKSEVQSWGGTVEYNHITAPSTTGVFSSKEPSQAAMDSQDAGWKDSMNDNNVMIVTIARSASENGSYNPGTAGVDPTQKLNQTDPLGLSDDERDLINAAVTAKAANGGKVIVLLNNASAMEVQEIEDNVGVDAILQVGLPGGYGFYGVADILSGAVSPSGHLTDTYAVKNASAPSAQNFGDLQWANANPDISMNDAIVEAENIYIGYKYYETRYFDTVMGQGNAASTVGSSTGSAWNYDDEVTYPFGYGLSYTTFEQTLDNLNVDLENETVTANVTVKNTGSVAGTPGQSVTFTLTPADGYTLTGADYPGASLTRTGAAYILTLPDVRYSVAVAVTAEKSDTVLYYNDNCGGGWVTVPVTPSHLRLNTAIDDALFTRPGYTLTGWNTAPDGSGQAVGLGSRTEPGARLYAQWAAQNDAAEFTYTVENDAAAITGWQGEGEVLVIPDTLGGAPVVEIAAGAFADAPCKTVIFPDTLRRVQPGAFSGSAAESVTLFDNLQQISDYAFEDCTSLQTLYINAATAPVYSGSYYATFADKYDRLLSLADTQKLVLFSGSSARFGYDSAVLDAALPHYEVVNMGVFAYTNALPQLELIRAQMRPGDLLLLSPEFDAAKRQFCTTNAFDDAFFCMAEADYDIVARLNLQQYSGVFSALGSYLQTRADMAARSYAVSPSDLDEDGNAVDTPSYNEYGDYVLYRPDAVDDTPIYGLPVDYMTVSFPYDTYIAPANAEFDRFAADGVRVYLTYSPRNSRAVSADSTPEAVAALDAYFRENLDVVFLTPLQDSLMPGRYFYGTDNHLSTNGVTMRTAQVIDALTKQLQGEGIAP